MIPERSEAGLYRGLGGRVGVFQLPANQLLVAVGGLDNVWNQYTSRSGQVSPNGVTRNARIHL